MMAAQVLLRLTRKLFISPSTSQKPSARKSVAQFGVTLMVYEILQNNFSYDRMTGTVKGAVGVDIAAQERVLSRSRNALKMLLDLDYKFGGINIK